MKFGILARRLAGLSETRQNKLPIAMALEKTDTLGIINNSPRARAIRHIQEWITDGRLAAGSRLPSEMRLASKLNVSRTTVRLALEDLREARNDPFRKPSPHR